MRYSWEQCRHAMFSTQGHGWGLPEQCEGKRRVGQAQQGMLDGADAGRLWYCRHVHAHHNAQACMSQQGRVTACLGHVVGVGVMVCHGWCTVQGAGGQACVLCASKQSGMLCPCMAYMIWYGTGYLHGCVMTWGMAVAVVACTTCTARIPSHAGVHAVTDLTLESTCTHAV